MINKDNSFETSDITESTRSLHTPGQFAKQNLLYVQEVGKLKSLTPHRCVREYLDSFLFLTVISGKGTLQVGDKEISISQGDCALIDCMGHYEHISDEENAWELAWVHFNGQIARSYYELFMKCNENDNVFHSDENTELIEVIDKLMARQNEKSVVAELKSGEDLLYLVNRIVELCVDKSEADREIARKQVDEMRSYINENYADDNIVANLQTQFGMSVATLNRSFDSYTGVSVEEYVSNRRMNAAKELLRFSVMPIEQVAIESGIGDLAYMQRLFETSEGISVEEYRRKWAHWIRK